MADSRYRQFSTKVLPKQKRRIKVWGADEDTGKYIRCWNCGAIVDVDRDLGDPDKSGLTYAAVTIPDVQPPHDDGRDERRYDIMLATWNGTPGDGGNSDYQAKTSTVVRGCWLCGCTNL